MKMSIFALFVFSILFTFDVYAGPYQVELDKASKSCGGQCYTVIMVNGSPQAACGNEYCLSCKSGWTPVKNPDPNTKIRCTQGNDEQAGGNNKWKPESDSCRSAGGIPEADGCRCIDDGTMLGSRSNCRDPLPAASPSPAPEQRVEIAGKTFESTMRACKAKGAEYEADDGNAGGSPYADSYGYICACRSTGKPPGDSICPSGQEAAKAAPTSAETQQAAADCLAKLKQNIQTCEATGEKAKEDCDAIKQSNSSYTESAKLIQGVGTILTARKAGSGDVSACAKATLGSAGAYLALDMMKGNCEEQRTTCTDKCSGIKNFVEKNSEKENILKACREKYVSENVAMGAAIATSLWEANIRPKITDSLNDLREEATASYKKCSIDSKTNEDAMLNLLNNANQATQLSAQCQCQESANGTNCENTPSPEDCVKDPTLDKCKLVLSPCAEGTAEYTNSKTCICYREPNNAICSANSNNNVTKIASVNPNGGPNNMATLGNSNIPSYKPGSGKDDFNLDTDGGRNTSGGPNGNTAAGGTPFGSAQNPGGGSAAGGLGAGGGTGLEDGGAGEDGSGQGSGGLFGAIRGMTDKLFGGGSGPNSANGKSANDLKGKDKEIDPNKWSKLRAIAGGAGMGGKNGNIWIQMNDQYKVQGTSPVPFLSPEGK